MALFLADARLPNGAHVHSGGMEQAVDENLVLDAPTLASFLRGRLLSAGVLAAHASAMACEDAGRCPAPEVDGWRALDDEVSARMISPALAATSRRQGRSLLRTGQVLVDHPVLGQLETLHPGGPHLAIVEGALAAASGLTPLDAALVSAYNVVTTTASSALRLLGLDPLSVAAVVSGCAGDLDAIAAEAGAGAGRDPVELPAVSAPATDLLAERHRAREERLFAS
jgi:urease accessory protein